MRHARPTIAALLLAWGMLLPDAPLQAQEEPGQRILPAALGGAAGLAAGGYLTLSLLVARARFQNYYVDDIRDFLSWNSVPVLVGTATGATLGYVSPERLTRGTVAGALGALGGLGVGLVLGEQIWSGPTGSWAGAAMGAGAGMTLGFLIGAAWPTGGEEEGETAGGAALPIVVRIPL